MRVVHEQDDLIDDQASADTRVLATNVEIADSMLSQARGLMFRSDLPADFALVMDLDGGGFLLSGPSRQVVHMLFMRLPIDVLWLVGDEVVKTARLSPWTGIGVAKADRIIELPAGNAEGVREGDTVRLEGGDADGDQG
jgi:uncharacterized membrane protein (UPF0127 family)